MTKRVKLLAALIVVWIAWFAFLAALIVVDGFPLWLTIVHWLYCALTGIATGLYIASVTKAKRRRSGDV
ncbi:hypothetical protein ACRCUN_06010 [Mycobacterium sp. LTG2003]